MKHIICILLLCAAAFAQGIGGAAGIGGTAGIGGGATLGPQTYSVDTTGLTANVSATTVSGLSSLSAAGFYCATGYEVVTTASTTSDTLPAINFIFTDSDSNTVETSNIAPSSSGTPQAVGTSLGTYSNTPTGFMCGYAKSGTAIQYSTTGYATSGAPSMTYALHFRVYGPISASSYSVDTTGLTANVSATTVPGLSALSANGYYCMRAYDVITTASSTSSALAGVNAIFTSGDSGTSESYAITTSPAGTPQAVGTTAGTYSGTPLSPFCFYAKSGTAIQYSTFGYLSTPGGMTYALHVRVVGPITSSSGAAVDTTGLTANVSSTTFTGLSSLPANGYYCVNSFNVITTAAGTSSTLPYVIITYTDADTSTVETSYIAGTQGGNTAGTYNGTFDQLLADGSFCFYAKSGTAIQYNTSNYASSAAGMTYSLHIRVIGTGQF